MNRRDTYYLVGSLLSGNYRAQNRDSVLNSLRSPNLNWPLLISTASNHLVLQTLYSKILEQELIEYIPPEVLTHLKYIFDLNFKKNTEILEQVVTINTILGNHGIAPLYLKGVGNILDGLYNNIAERIMFDIDFMVPDEQLELSAHLLINHGYVPVKEYQPEKKAEMKHYPRLIKPGTRAPLEIHRLPVDYIFSCTFGAREVWENKKPLFHGSKCFVMSDRDKIIQNFIHSQLHHEGNLYAKVFMRNIYDLYLLSKREDLTVVFSGINRFKKQAANYLIIMEKAFGIHKSRLPFSGYSGRGYLFRHEINLRNSWVSRFTYMFIKVFRAYFKLPFRAIHDKELRVSIIKRILNWGWYGQHLKSYRRNSLKYGNIKINVD